LFILTNKGEVRGERERGKTL